MTCSLQALGVVVVGEGTLGAGNAACCSSPGLSTTLSPLGRTLTILLVHLHFAIEKESYLGA